MSEEAQQGGGGAISTQSCSMCVHLGAFWMSVLIHVCDQLCIHAISLKLKLVTDSPWI